MFRPHIPNPQVVGNVGLYYVCFKLSLNGWNVMPTSRNAPGIDILIYSQDASRKQTIQVKARRKETDIDLGDNQTFLFDFLVVCPNVMTEEAPRCFVLTEEEVRRLCRRKKDGKFWLRARDYRTDGFRENWELIGSGLTPLAPSSRPQAGPITLGR